MLLGGYTKGIVEWSVWMLYIYWSSMDTIQNMYAHARERECAHNGERGIP